MILSGPFVIAPTTLAAVCVVAAASYVATLWIAASARMASVFAWAIGAHAVALVLDVLGGGAGARFGFATALSMTVWLVVVAHWLERKTLPLAAPRRLLAGAGILACVLMAAFPGEHRQAESPWAPMHWLLGIVSYGLMGAAVAHACLLDRAEKRLRGVAGLKPARVAEATAPGAIPLLTLERLTFRFVDAGFVVLTLALMLGAWFAWQGHTPWRWTNHKTVLSVAGWVVFALLVVGRHVRGWRGRRATRWVYGGALLLLLSYVGSQFVLSVLLGRPGA